MWRDSSGRTLAEHDHPSLAVDVAVLTVDDGRLLVLVHERDAAAGSHAPGRLALPGTFLGMDETLAQAALRALRDKVGVTGREPRQLRVFDAPDRDDRGRVLSVAHVDLVPRRVLDAAPVLPGVLRVPVAGRRAVLPEGHDALAYDHDAVLAVAVDEVRRRHDAEPDPDGLLAPEGFTLLELQQLHQAVLGAPVGKDTFRRRMIGGLEATGAMTAGSVGKPARLYRVAGHPAGTERTRPGARRTVDHLSEGTTP